MSCGGGEIIVSIVRICYDERAMVIPEALRNILVMFGVALIFAPLLTVKKFHINIILSTILLMPFGSIVVFFTLPADSSMVMVILLSVISLTSFAVLYTDNASTRTKNKTNTRKFLPVFLLRLLLLLAGTLAIYGLLALDARYNSIPPDILMLSIFTVFVAGFIAIAVIGILKFIKSVKW